VPEILPFPPGPLHEHLPTLPLFGDTTSNQALLFSPPFERIDISDPTFPNYTLPSANLSLPPPTQTPTFTLILGPTSSFPIINLENDSTGSKLPLTACALQNTINDLVAGQLGDTSANVESSIWLRDQQGWRGQFLVNGLAPSTNYTAFVVQDGSKISGPINMVTKSGMSSVFV